MGKASRKTAGGQTIHVEALAENGKVVHVKITGVSLREHILQDIERELKGAELEAKELEGRVKLALIKAEAELYGADALDIAELVLEAVLQ